MIRVRRPERLRPGAPRGDADAGAQRVGGGEAWRTRAEGRTEGADRLELAGAGGAAGQVLALLRLVRAGQLAVGQGVQPRLVRLARVAHAAPCVVGRSASRSRPRARDRRDITVPTGTPVTSPISRYD